jgi:hypothetical protein
MLLFEETNTQKNVSRKALSWLQAWYMHGLHIASVDTVRSWILQANVGQSMHMPNHVEYVALARTVYVHRI